MNTCATVQPLKIINLQQVNTNFTTSIEGFVTAGFPSPATDYVENELNFKELFIRNESATFFVKAEGNSMIGAGIFDGDILVVDKSLRPNKDSILVCFVNGEFTVKRVNKISGKLFLIPENPDFQPIEIDENADFRLWGVVTFTIHKFI